MPLTIALGSDEQTPLTDFIEHHLSEQGHRIIRFGALQAEQDAAWSIVGAAVGSSVAAREADFGIVLCWTGTGVSMAANKIKGVRAALCTDTETARGARLWNDANVLALSLRLTTEQLAKEILAAWLETSFKNDAENQTCLEHLRRAESQNEENG
jgi:ribose 5-phosphate isomerase B